MNTPAKMLSANAWKIEESLDLYQVEAWGKGYFSINEAGHVVIRPGMDATREIDLVDFGQGSLAGSALNQFHAKLLFQFANLHRQCGLRDRTRLSGPTEMPILR